jgi:inorganic pyrophosphatase
MKFFATIEVGKGQKRRFTKSTHENLLKIKDYSMPFQWNYGYINNTLSTDGDELDVFIFGCKYKPFDIVKVKPRFVIYTIENGVEDNKVLAGRVGKKDLSRVLEVLIGNTNRIVRGIGNKEAAIALIKKETIKGGNV